MVVLSFLFPDSAPKAPYQYSLAEGKRRPVSARSAALGKRKKERLALKARHKDNQLLKTLDPWLGVENIIRLEALFQR